LAIACLALLAGGAVNAQFTEPPYVIDAIGRAMDDIEDEIEEQIDAQLGLQEWREALGSLDGTWEGQLAVIAATDNTPAQFWHVGDHPELQIGVEHDTAVVRVKADGWQALNIGDGFHTLDLTGGGFVYAVQSANGWVENWNLSVAKKDPDTLLVFLSFVAGRSLEQLATADADFAVGAMGELKRRTE
jgi:hypothetical protein